MSRDTDAETLLTAMGAGVATVPTGRLSRSSRRATVRTPCFFVQDGKVKVTVLSPQSKQAAI